jgi:hypothetical protein
MIMDDCGATVAPIPTTDADGRWPMADAWFSSKSKTFFCAEGQSHAEADRLNVLVVIE